MTYAIESRDLSKRYRLGVSGTGWLVRDVRDWMARTLGRPMRRIEEAGELREDHIWALKDVSFEVEPGEVMGVVGRNGAGKSTLLKVLSRITRPTSGSAVVRGRIASLLEVGTGFHPELTGRENVFLNGAILGMSRQEIRERFDEIISFAGVESFVDTPVKRFSSGMYLRLAFAVAAHLRSEILLVDEVLAVGDVEFQRKCLEKIEDVGHQGRTVLFISHNMGSLLTLCQTGILLENGEVKARGHIQEVVDRYLKKHMPTSPGLARRPDFDPETQVLESAEILDADMERNAIYQYGDPMHIRLTAPEGSKQPYGLEVRIRNSKQELVAYASSWIGSEDEGVFDSARELRVTIPALKLVQDDYLLDFNLRIPHLYHVDAWWEAVGFSVVSCRPPGSPFSVARSDHWGSTILDDVRVEALE